MASNAGGTAGTNTWILASDGAPLPAYVAILPPVNWSGTLPGGDGAGNGLTLIVTSGETSLPDALAESFPLAPVVITPVANGVTLDVTSTFGQEGRVIPLNLNAAMVDSQAVPDVIPADGSVETTTLEITGLGQYAAFYNGVVLRTAGISYDLATDTYTLTGLSQAQLDNLGYTQANRAITDVDAATAGRQIRVTAWTVDGSDVSAEVTDTLTLNVTAQTATTGNDQLLWTGAAINGGAGTDTIRLRYGESLTGTQLGTNLRNIEVLDLGIAGANDITGLTPDQVKLMIGSGTSLSILGNGDDGIGLAGSWRDNGDGTYTGTLTPGGGTVTLTVAAGVEVTEPSGGFLPAGRMAMMRLDAEDDSFGLATLDDDSSEPAPAVASVPEVTEDALFARADSDATDDLAALLPEETRDTQTSGASGADSLPAAEDRAPYDGQTDWGTEAPATLLADALEDELLQNP